MAIIVPPEDYYKNIICKFIARVLCDGESKKFDNAVEKIGGGWT